MIRNLWPWDGQPTQTDPSTLTDRRDGIIAAWEYLGHRHTIDNGGANGLIVLICVLLALCIIGLIITR